MVKMLLDDMAKGAQRRRSTASRLGGRARRIYLVGPHQPPAPRPRLYERCRCYLNAPPPRVCADYEAAALVAITGVAGGEREAAMGSAAAVGPSPQVRGRWIMMAGALPRPVSCVCVLLSSLLLCTRVRVVFVGAAAVEFAVVCFFSLSLSPLSPLPSSLSLLPHAGFPNAYAALLWLKLWLSCVSPF